MRIIFNNQIYEIDDGLIKLSDYIKLLYETDPFEPIPLIKCDEEIFEIFTIWFNELKKVGIVEIPENILRDNGVFVFKFKMFMNYDVETLYQLLEFSFGNQIFLLFETISLAIATKYENEEFKIEQLDENYYTIDNIKISKFYINIINNKNEKIFKVHQKEINELNEQIEELEEQIEKIKEQKKN